MRTILTAVTAGLMLAACGGGDSKPPSAIPAPFPAPVVPVVTPPPAPPAAEVPVTPPAPPAPTTPVPTPPVVVTPPPVTTPPVTPDPAPATPVYSAGVTSLRTLAPFPVGAAVSYGNETFSYTSSAVQQALLKKHFSQLTAGNIMKMSYLHPSQDTFTFGQADSMVKFAADNNMTVHAHALIWHSDYQVPGFMKTFAGDKPAFLAMLKTHVQTIAGHFAGKVASWDVVNEAINDGGGMRNSLFFQKTGTDYIDQAFINARAADATADLYYNDYNTEADAAKLKTMTEMVDGMLARGVPITGVGFQMHIYMDYPSVSTISASFKSMVDRKLKVKISELDIPINNPYSGAYKGGDVKKVLTMDLALAQKKRYCEVVKAYLDTVPPNLRGGVTVWGVNDPSSWLIGQLFNNTHDDWPLLFDAQYQDKPALRGVADALNGQACTAL